MQAVDLENQPPPPAQPSIAPACPVVFDVLTLQCKKGKGFFSWFIPAIVSMNVVVFLITMYVNNCPKNSDSCRPKFLGRFSFQHFEQHHDLGPSGLTIWKMGALYISSMVDDHQWWRLFTCIWLHGGILHLFCNMLSLLSIGVRLEQEFGFVLIGVIYIISGFGGSLLSALFLGSGLSLGASGAISGLVGCMLSELITNWSLYANQVAACSAIILYIVSTLASGLFPFVDNFGHLGGLVVGFLLGFVLLIRPQRGCFRQRHTSPSDSASTKTARFKMYQCVLWVVSLILLIVGLSVGLVVLLKGYDAQQHCSWCHYIDCVPISKSCKKHYGHN